MKFILSKEDRKHLERLLITNENNYDVSNMLLYYFYHEARSINAKDIEAMIKINSLDNKDAFFYSLMNLLEIDLNEEESISLAKSYCYDAINELDLDSYINNPYLQNIKFNKTNIKNIKITYDAYLPYEGFSLDDLKVDEDNYFQEQYSIGYFKKKFTFPSITHDNITWMSIIPNEINTMRNDIELVQGKVLVYGLGLGYFAYMISLKETVKEITIVENNPKIISLFQQIILPQFQYKEKIKIINQDAFIFEKTCKEKFDYAYVDIYHSNEDGTELYLKFKNLELLSNHYLYWLENSLINTIRRNLITIIYEQFTNQEANYTLENNINDRIINNLYKILQNKTFTSYQEIKNLLRSESIEKMVKENQLI